MSKNYPLIIESCKLFRDLKISKKNMKIDKYNKR